MTLDFYNNIIILDNIILYYVNVQRIFSDNQYIIIICKYNINIQHKHRVPVVAVSLLKTRRP